MSDIITAARERGAEERNICNETERDKSICSPEVCGNIKEAEEAVKEIMKAAESN